jgi:hypothetical protein
MASVINQPRASIVAVYEQIEKDLLGAIKYLPNTTFYDNGCRITRPAAQALLASVMLSKFLFLLLQMLTVIKQRLTKRKRLQRQLPN